MRKLARRCEVLASLYLEASRMLASIVIHSGTLSVIVSMTITIAQERTFVEL